jgi:spermidine synthase
MREMIATFYGNELLVGLILMAWLAWVAIGAWGLGNAIKPHRVTPSFLGLWLVLAGLLLLVELFLIRSTRGLLGVTPGAYIEFGPLVVAILLILAPLCVISGMSFTLGARLFVQEGKQASQAYIWEAIGAVVGGTLFSFVLIHLLNPFQNALLILAVNIATSIPLASSTRPKSIQRLIPPLLSLGMLLPIAFFLGQSLNTLTLSWQWGDWMYISDSPYGRITVQARNGQRIFYQNGLLSFETQGTFPEEVVHFPLLVHPKPKRILLIGGGVAGDVREALKHPVEEMIYVELDPILIQAALAHLPPEDASFLQDPRVSIELTDGRLYVRQAADNIQTNTAEPFDVVILNLPEPSTGSINRFYTHEFFLEVYRVLHQGGIFALNLPSSEAYWSLELARRNGSVFKTLEDIFPEVVVLPGEHNFYLASTEPFETHPSTLADRLTEREVETRWLTPGYLTYVFDSDRIAKVNEKLMRMEDVRINRDLLPICYYYDLALWLSRFYPNLRGVFEHTSLFSIWWIVIPLGLIVITTRFRRDWAIPVTIAGVGLAQMMLQVVILFTFQVLYGYLFAEVSLIITAFMAGLAMGSAGSQAWVIRTALRNPHHTKHMLITVLAAILIFSALFPFIVSLPLPSPKLIFPIFALAAGLLTGTAFPLALNQMAGEAGRVAGALYGVDLVGGCVGALFGAVFLIPVLGIPLTCAVIALVGAASLLTLVG